jgi:hypothetical protein
MLKGEEYAGIGKTGFKPSVKLGIRFDIRLLNLHQQYYFKTSIQTLILHYTGVASRIGWASYKSWIVLFSQQSQAGLWAPRDRLGGSGGDWLIWRMEEVEFWFCEAIRTRTQSVILNLSGSNFAAMQALLVHPPHPS